MPKTAIPAHDVPPGPENAAPEPNAGPRAPVFTAVIIVLVLLVAAGGWFAYQSFTGQPATGPDLAELTAIDARLTAIQDRIRPIATTLATQTETSTPGVIDVVSLRADVKQVRDLVDSTNDLSATSADALEIRDLVLTGGSQVVAGMQETLDALAADDPSAMTAAAVHVEEGQGNLQDARRRLDVLLGRIGTA
jgi:hypothetical protein